MHLLDYCNPLQLALLLTWCGRNTDIVTSSHDSSWFPWCSSALLLLQPRAAATFISKTTVSATLVIQTTTRATVVIRMLWHHPRPLMLRPALQLLLQPRAAAALHLQDYTSLFKLLHLKEITMHMEDLCGQVTSFVGCTTLMLIWYHYSLELLHQLNRRKWPWPLITGWLHVCVIFFLSNDIRCGLHEDHIIVNV